MTDYEDLRQRHLAELTGLPPMTKDDLMGNWDQVVTDRRLSLERWPGSR
jgi:hypothetical protein